MLSWGAILTPVRQTLVLPILQTAILHPPGRLIALYHPRQLRFYPSPRRSSLRIYVSVGVIGSVLAFASVVKGSILNRFSDLGQSRVESPWN